MLSQKFKGYLSVLAAFLIQFVNKANIIFIIIYRLLVLNMHGLVLIHILLHIYILIMIKVSHPKKHIF